MITQKLNSIEISKIIYETKWFKQSVKTDNQPEKNRLNKKKAIETPY